MKRIQENLRENLNVNQFLLNHFTSRIINNGNIMGKVYDNTQRKLNENYFYYQIKGVKDEKN